MERITSKIHKIAVLTSGMSRGSNLQAMARFFLERNLPVSIAFVIYTKKSAPIKDVCSELHIPAIYISTKELTDFEIMLNRLIEDFQIDLIALAGFLKKLSSSFCENCSIPILNIHPALLPDYGGKGMYGMAVHRAVYEAKEQFSGASVHVVNQYYDEGEIIIQRKTDISNCSTPEEIAERVLKIEHQIYGEAIQRILNI